MTLTQSTPSIAPTMASAAASTASYRIAKLATCNLCQWAMDFTGNAGRIRQSIDEARTRGARYRLGPELEVPGYGCEDHFNERDTEVHSWESIAALLRDGYSDGIVVDLGTLVTHKGVRYNCRIFVLDKRYVLGSDSSRLVPRTPACLLRSYPASSMSPVFPLQSIRFAHKFPQSSPNTLQKQSTAHQAQARSGERRELPRAAVLFSLD